MPVEKSSLEKLLLRGNKQIFKDQTSWENLFDQFGYEQSEGQSFPVAAVTALSDLEGSEGRTWMRVDPVFLHADLISLLLFDSQSFSLTKEETKGLFSIINPMIEEDRLRLISGDDPLRWYLELEKLPSMTTTSPGTVNGQEIRPYLPVGKDQAYWIRLANEIQMLLHECSINIERQKRGEVPINSVWFWGAGKVPEQMTSKFDQVISNDVNAKGLAICAGIPHKNIPDDFDHFLDEEEKKQRLLVVLSQGKMAQGAVVEGDLALSEVESSLQWPIFDSLLSGLKRGKINQLEIITRDQHRIVKRSHLYRFWRK